MKESLSESVKKIKIKKHSLNPNNLAHFSKNWSLLISSYLFECDDL